jgi:SAM-dependent MidA family methyltransferase
VLDAVPVAIVARRAEAWLERGVTWDERATRLRLGGSTADARLGAIAAARFPPHGDYTSESTWRRRRSSATSVGA